MPGPRLTVPCPTRIVVEMDGEQLAPRRALQRARTEAKLSREGLSCCLGHAKDQIRLWETAQQNPGTENWIRAILACGYVVKIERKMTVDESK
jgi:hypothetical protein